MKVSLYLPIWISSPSASDGAVAAATVDVRAVEAALVDDDPGVALAHDHRVVARHGDVVQEDGGVRVTADGDAVAAQRVRLAGAPAAAADDQAGVVAGHAGERVGGAVLLAGDEAQGGGGLGLVGDEAGAAAHAEAGSLRVADAALRAEHVTSSPGSPGPAGPRALAGQDAREALDVHFGDDGLALVVLALQAQHQLCAQDVELAVQDAAPARDLALFRLELSDQGTQLLVRTRDQVDDVVHGASPRDAVEG